MEPKEHTNRRQIKVVDAIRNPLLDRQVWILRWIFGLSFLRVASAGDTSEQQREDQPCTYSTGQIRRSHLFLPASAIERRCVERKVVQKDPSSKWVTEDGEST